MEVGSPRGSSVGWWGLFQALSTYSLVSREYVVHRGREPTQEERGELATKRREQRTMVFHKNGERCTKRGTKKDRNRRKVRAVYAQLD